MYNFPVGCLGNSYNDQQQLEFPGTWAISQPDRVAVLMVGSGEKMTYLELDEKANRISNLFVGLGLQPGDHIAFCLENTIDFLPLAWGAHYAGLYYTAISSRLTEEEMSSFWIIQITSHNVVAADNDFTWFASLGF